MTEEVIHNPITMNMKTLVRLFLSHPEARGLDLDSREAVNVHARLIRSKAFLNKLYRYYYADFLTAHERAGKGLRLEIGSGGGFLKELIPEVVTIDLRPGADVDTVASALQLPFRQGSVGAVFMLNVLHHLPDAELFFREVERVLRPGGRLVAIEPFVSPFSKLVFRYLHHEPFDPSSEAWTLEQSGPMSAANGALPWIVLIRDRQQFERLFSGLEIKRVCPHTFSLYLLSGGVSMRSFVPGWTFEPLVRLEGMLGRHLKYLATLMTVELERKLEL